VRACVFARAVGISSARRQDNSRRAPIFFCFFCTASRLASSVHLRPRMTSLRCPGRCPRTHARACNIRYMPAATCAWLGNVLGAACTGGRRLGLLLAADCPRTRGGLVHGHRHRLRAAAGRAWRVRVLRPSFRFVAVRALERRIFVVCGSGCGAVSFGVDVAPPERRTPGRGQ
jgi:hypothetical protein